MTGSSRKASQARGGVGVSAESLKIRQELGEVDLSTGFSPLFSVVCDENAQVAWLSTHVALSCHFSEVNMSDAAISNEPAIAHARIVFLGPVSPHWEVYGDWGDAHVLDEFRARVLARLVLLPRDDPQFRRNMARIVRDAERERISLEWDMGDPNYEF